LGEGAAKELFKNIPREKTLSMQLHGNPTAQRDKNEENYKILPPVFWDGIHQYFYNFSIFFLSFF
jgi:hypothetical protein